MLRGQPKSAATAPPAHAAGRGPAAQVLGAPARRKPDPTQPRKSHKSSLLQAILADTKLDADAVKRVVKAGAEGVDLASLSCLVVYQLEIARRCYADGTLASKDFLVAVGKVAQQVAAAVQLESANPAHGPATVTVHFDAAPSVPLGVLGDLHAVGDRIAVA